MNRMSKTSAKKPTRNQRCHKAKVKRLQARNKLTWFVMAN